MHAKEDVADRPCPIPFAASDEQVPEHSGQCMPSGLREHEDVEGEGLMKSTPGDSTQFDGSSARQIDILGEGIADCRAPVRKLQADP